MEDRAEILAQPLEADGQRSYKERPERKEVERDLVGVASLRNVSKNFGLVVLEEAAKKKIDDLFK